MLDKCCPKESWIKKKINKDEILQTEIPVLLIVKTKIREESECAFGVNFGDNFKLSNARRVNIILVVQKYIEAVVLKNSECIVLQGNEFRSRLINLKKEI